MPEGVGRDRSQWAMPSSLQRLLSGVRTILWDFDGVIADTEPVQEYSYNSVLSEFGIVAGSDWFASLIGRSEPEIWAALTRQYDLPITIAELMTRRSEIYLPRAKLTVSPNSFVQPMLEYGRRQKTLNVILSSGGFGNIGELLAHWSIMSNFADIYCMDSPNHPDLRTKSERLGHAAESYAYPMVIIEDSQQVLDLAETMGLRTIAVRHRLNTAKRINADFIIDVR